MLQFNNRGLRLVLAGGLAAALPCSAADRGSAERALADGRVDEAVATLKTMVAANGRDGAAHLLLCRAYYAEEFIDPAVSECEAAIANGGNSDAASSDWMGRAYGRKADHAGALTGFSLAKKVKAAFERAVQLDPGSSAAVNDLSEYYVGAPSIVGGGLDKALALADKVAASLPQSAHRIRAMVAEKKKDYGAAEREFRAAAEAPGKVNGWNDLGDFHSRRGQTEQAVTAVRKSIAENRTKDSSLVDAASILNGLHKDPQIAEKALREYLASGAKSDAAPAFHVHTMLGQMRAQAGDKAGARAEYEAALAMAAGYLPARKALESNK